MKKIWPIAAIGIVVVAYVFYSRLPSPPAMTKRDDVQTIYSPAVNLGSNEYDVPYVKDAQFGATIAIFDGRMLVSAPTANNGEDEKTGLVYLFDTTTGELLREFSIPRRNPEDGIDPYAPVDGSGQPFQGRGHEFFGSSVALNKDYALIGAPSAVGRMGAAYLFDVKTGAFLHRFSNPDRVLYSYFGSHVALSETRALIGGDNPEQGTQYEQSFVFDLEDTDRMLRLPLGEYSLRGSWIKSVAFNEQYTAISRNAYFYVAVAGTPELRPTAQVDVFDTCSGERVASFENPHWFDHDFGRDIALHGHRLLIGAPFISGSENTESYGLEQEGRTFRGSVFLYDIKKQTLIKELTDLEAPELLRFGTSVALNATHAIVASSWEHYQGHMSYLLGEIYAFDLLTGDVVFNETTAEGHSSKYIELAVDDKTLAVGVRMDDQQAKNAGVTYVIPLPASFMDTNSAETTTPDADFSIACQTAFNEASESASAIDAEAVRVQQLANETAITMTPDEISEALTFDNFDPAKVRLIITESELGEALKAMLILELTRYVINSAEGGNHREELRSLLGKLRQLLQS